MRLPLELCPDRITACLHGQATPRRHVKFVVDHWPDAETPHRSTVDRWLKGSLPRTSHEFLTLCAVLDADPFSLLRPTKDSFYVAERLLSAFNIDRLPSSLEFLEKFSGRRHFWPPKELSVPYGRDWILQDIQHQPSAPTGFYASILLTRSRDVDPIRPQVVHFAFGSPTHYDGRWLHYGFVTFFGSNVSLLHINGTIGEYEQVDLSAPAHVQTYFGPQPVTFRLASLHRFEARLAEQNEATEPFVRFI